MYRTEVLLQLAWTAFASSTYQILLTIAFAIVLKVLKVWNLTQAAVMAVAFYVMYVCNVVLGLHAFVGVAAALIVTALMSTAIEVLAFRTLRARNSESITLFIFTLTFASFTAFLLTLIFTTQPVFMLRDMMVPMHMVMGIVVSEWEIRAVAITAVLVAATWWVLRRTRIGQHMVAVADNPDLAEIFGINRSRVYLVTMLLSAVLITGATYIFGGKLTLFPTLPVEVMLFALAATILGGVGNVFAAGVAAIVIAQIQQFSVLVLDSKWQALVVYALLLIAVVFFPRGIRWPARRVARAALAAPPGNEA